MANSAVVAGSGQHFEMIGMIVVDKRFVVVMVLLVVAIEAGKLEGNKFVDYSLQRCHSIAECIGCGMTPVLEIVVFEFEEWEAPNVPVV